MVDGADERPGCQQHRDDARPGGNFRPARTAFWAEAPRPPFSLSRELAQCTCCRRLKRADYMNEIDICRYVFVIVKQCVVVLQVMNAVIRSCRRATSPSSPTSYPSPSALFRAPRRPRARVSCSHPEARSSWPPRVRVWRVWASVTTGPARTHRASSSIFFISSTPHLPYSAPPAS